MGFLLLLKQLLQPECGPVVAVLPIPDSARAPHAEYGRPEAALRWQHPFFEDIKTCVFPEYAHVQPSKYAEKVHPLSMEFKVHVYTPLQ